MALQGPAVYLAMPGMIPHVPDTNTSSLKQMLEVFVESGGRLLVCIPCMEERNLKATDLIEQAVPTSGSALTEEILSAKAILPIKNLKEKQTSEGLTVDRFWIQRG